LYGRQVGGSIFNPKEDSFLVPIVVRYWQSTFASDRDLWWSYPPLIFSNLFFGYLFLFVISRESAFDRRPNLARISSTRFDFFPYCGTLKEVGIFSWPAYLSRAYLQPSATPGVAFAGPHVKGVALDSCTKALHNQSLYNSI